MPQLEIETARPLATPICPRTFTHRWDPSAAFSFE